MVLRYSGLLFRVKLGKVLQLRSKILARDFFGSKISTLNNYCWFIICFIRLNLNGVKWI